MSGWVAVARVADFPPGSVRIAESEGTEIAVFNLDGRFYAIEDVCSHDEERLSRGEVQGEAIECPRHGARFSVITGAALTPPAYEPVRTFPVRIEQGVVWVRDDRWD
jgi:3-phenylpropionate/trans-cinnamate dioxygenase ferredoxin subunit